MKEVSMAMASLPKKVETVSLQCKKGNCQIWFSENLEISFWKSREGEIIFNRLYILTQLGFVREPSEILRKDTENHVLGGEFICIATNKNEIVAYVVLNLWQTDIGKVLYLSGIMVDPGFQGMNISSVIMQYLIKKMGAEFLVLRTQNPILYQSATKMCKEIFPSINDGLNPIAKKIGCYAAEKLGMKKYDSDKMTERGTYGGCMYGREPICSILEIENWFKKTIDISQGDSMIIMGIVNE